ncbi:MAG: acetolactate decarboxylase [Planctomycetes bacterium]|jgi:acetolactate decarboxylase|nr:acetolactate decarboxylase [Planctomycetota bacterium]
MRRITVCVLMLGLLAGAGCSRPADATDAVWQTATLPDLLAGSYDGETTFDELRQHGDFGIGTLDALDGEMLADGGRFYQIRSDGKVYAVGDDMTTPFAAVKFFRPDKTLVLEGPLSFEQLKERLDAAGPDESRFCAFRITGSFSQVRTRSVPRQHKPYPRLTEVVKTQPVFELNNVSGTLVGFRLPKSAAGMNVAGYHFHFITDDRAAGGHVQDLTVESAKVQIDESNELTVRLQSPHSLATSTAGQLEQETNQVE